MQDDNVIQVNANATIGAPVSSFKGTLAVRLNDFGLCANGSAIISDTLGTLPTPTQATIGYSTSGGNTTVNGPIRRINYWPRRLHDSTLQSIIQ